MKQILFSTVLLWALVLPLERAHAADNQGGLTLSPMFQEISLEKNEQQKDFLVTLTNNTGSLMTLRLSLLDFGSLDESGGVAFLGATNDLEKKYALASWMRPGINTLTLAPGESQKVRVTIENRDTLSPGGHYGALVFKVGDDTVDPNVSNEIAINQLFSVLVFVKKLGGEIYSLDLKGNEYAKSSISLPEEIETRFQNSGNVHVTPRGTVTITDPLGHVVSKGIINEESGLILPETFRTYPAHLRSLALAFIPGRYTLHIAYRYDGKDDFIVKTEQFEVFPLPAIIGVLLIGAIIVGWYVSRQRRKTGVFQASSGFDGPRPADT